jgi:hypothetical protein
MMHYVDLNQLSKKVFYKDIVPTIEHIVDEMMEELCRIGRSLTPDPYDVWIIVDTGWSHPGHWANESTTILCDGKTGLPLTVQHVIRGQNYKGSSQGKVIDSILIVLQLWKNMETS